MVLRADTEEGRRSSTPLRHHALLHRLPTGWELKGKKPGGKKNNEKTKVFLCVFPWHHPTKFQGKLVAKSSCDTTFCNIRFFHWKSGI